MDATFLDLIYWILLPLILLFAVWVIRDCVRTESQSLGIRITFVVVIALLPVLGGILWFRFKERRSVGQSSLMTRVSKRRGVR